MCRSWRCFGAWRSVERTVDDLSEALRVIKLVVLDFDGVLTDNRVLVMEDGSEGVVCNRSDGIGIQAARELGIKFLVLSKEKNPVVQEI